jgi:DNA phosphorothioation-associated putative methyltransferase
MTSIGKKVFDDLYIHKSALDLLAEESHKRLVASAISLLPLEACESINVYKINTKTGRISLLEYTEFEAEAFPTLLSSWVIEPRAETPTHRTYRNSLNPPILHRKELLVDIKHPKYREWTVLTKEAESIGLFEKTRTIGFKKNWEILISEKGYELTENKFVKKDSESIKVIEEIKSEKKVFRHLTAIERFSLSVPVQLMIKNGLINPDNTFFDFGCGKGSDILSLTEAGINAKGWDPYYASENEIVEADIVNLGFVLNVIEDPIERADALQKAFQLARKVLSISVMLYGPEQPGRPHKDGHLTNRNTFQKYFSQGEIKDYIEHALSQQVFMIGPGVAIVFKDKDFEQTFNARRFKSNDLTHRLLSARILRTNINRPHRQRIPKQTNSQKQFENAKSILDKLWELTLDLGRLPDVSEFNDSAELIAQVGSYSRGIRLIRTHFEFELIEVSAKQRSGELLLYLASQQFEKRPAYKKLEPRIQRDIKYFFNDYKSALGAGLKLIISAADPDEILKACDEASAQGIGWLDSNQALHFHIQLLDRLPVILRAYVNCGLIIWDSMSDVHIVKIHIGSGKLSLFEFENFDTSPLPLLKKRIKINLRKQDYDVFEYGSEQYPSSVLYRKSDYMHEDMNGYAEQLAFDQALVTTRSIDPTTFGPSIEELMQQLELQRLTISGYEIIPSEKIPSLDQACGANFTFKDFIQCGATQKRLGLENVPFNPKTYNALLKITIDVLDPVIDYFGAVKLTYGFSSQELTKNIEKNVTSKLDQHSGYECNRFGKPFCNRLGIAIDFIVEDENMFEVAQWIAANCEFDRIHFYGNDRPLHVSVTHENSKQVAVMLVRESSKRSLPQSMNAEQFLTLSPDDLTHTFR